MADTGSVAASYGIQSIPAAIVFAVLYLFFLLQFIFQAFKRRSHVYYSLIFFCLIRMTSFILRAILAGPAGNNVGLLIGDLVLFNIGFFSLLYSAYNLVLDRERVSVYPVSTGLISRVIRKRYLFRLALLAAIVIGSIGISDLNTSNDPSTVSTGQSLHLASTIIFLVLVVLFAYQTLNLAKYELRGGGLKQKTGKLGERYGTYILLAISLLLVLRQAFTMAAVNDPHTLSNEHFWYPLIALPEILVVAMYNIPELVPPRQSTDVSVQPGLQQNGDPAFSSRRKRRFW